MVHGLASEKFTNARPQYRPAVGAAMKGCFAGSLQLEFVAIEFGNGNGPTVTVSISRSVGAIVCVPSAHDAESVRGRPRFLQNQVAADKLHKIVRFDLFWCQLEKVEGHILRN